MFHDPDGTSTPLLGGSAANICFHSARLGAESLLVSRVGNDKQGRLAIDKIAALGVTSTGITVDPRRPTGQVDIRMVDGEPEFQVREGVAWDHIQADAQLLTRMFELDVLCFGTLAQRTSSARDTWNALSRRISAHGAPRLGPGSNSTRHRRPALFVDLNLRPPFNLPQTILDTIRFADLIKLNDAELAWIVTTFGTKAPIEFLFSHSSAKWVALTHGRNGASLVGRTVRMHVPGVPVQGGDPVGAGDSFLANFAVEMSTGSSLHRCLERANRYASWVASQRGAMPDGR